MYVYVSKRLSVDARLQQEVLLTVLAREERLAFEHFGENAPRAPDVDCDIVLLPCEHNFRRSVVSR